jgi:hypothetical protein
MLTSIPDHGKICKDCRTQEGPPGRYPPRSASIGVPCFASRSAPITKISAGSQRSHQDRPWESVARATRAEKFLDKGINSVDIRRWFSGRPVPRRFAWAPGILRSGRASCLSRLACAPREEIQEIREFREPFPGPSRNCRCATMRHFCSIMRQVCAARKPLCWNGFWPERRSGRRFRAETDARMRHIWRISGFS